MKTESLIGVSLTAALMLSSLNVLAQDDGDGDDFGAVYTMTNSTSGNEIVMFDRSEQGALTAVGTIATQGLGVGGGIDPLGSQHSLVLSRDDHWLIAVNAGSSDISVLRVVPHGLQFADKVASGGTQPVSVAVFHDLVYVLNGGGTPNITGFRLGHHGQLTALANSTRTLPTSAFGEVGFDERGETLLVTDKGNSQILAFPVNAQGLPAASAAVSASSGKAPFGFTFDHENHLLVVEAASDAVSSYQIGAGSALQNISASVQDGQKASCWIALAGRHYAFTANPGTQTISAFGVDDHTGVVSLLNATAATSVKPIDTASTRSGRYLYALDVSSMQIDAFQVGRNGSLTSLGSVAGGFANYAQGIAVR